MIKVWNYLPEYRLERAEILAAVEKVLESGQLILGESVRAFEQAFAAFCGVRHGVGVDNGTNALTLALRALGLRCGDEVITVANTAVPTVSAIVSAGGVPRFVDIRPGTYLMDVDRLAAALTPRTRFLLPVHLYGQCVEMTPLLDFARAHDLRVLEDCAQSHGARQGGRVAGSFGQAAAFSFYPTKLLGTFGDGGMVCTDEAELDARLRRLRFYGMERTYDALEHGYNARLDELHAEILLRRLPRLEANLARRQVLAARYDRELTGIGLTLPTVAPGNTHAYYLYVARHPRRDALLAALKARDIHLNVSYPWPIHTMRAYAYLGGRAGDLPETEAAAREIFSLPLYPGLGDDEQETVIAALRELSPALS
jgi:aminotransferase EvaB